MRNTHPYYRDMSIWLGGLVRAERERRRFTLHSFVTAYHDAGYDIHPSTLSLMETGKREGDPQTWSGLWRFLGLPWGELYREWGLPSPDEGQGEDAEVAEIAHAVSRLDSPRRQVVSRFVQSLDYIVEPMTVTIPIDRESEAGLNSGASRPEGVAHDRRGVGSATVRGTRRLAAANAAVSRELSELSARSAGGADAGRLSESGAQ